MYYDLSSFQVYMELFHFPLVCVSKTSELKSLSTGRKKLSCKKDLYFDDGKRDPSRNAADEISIQVHNLGTVMDAERSITRLRMPPLSE